MGDDRRAIFNRVKRATVALAFSRKTPGPSNRPFETLGSGFCVDPRGVIVTCRHVIEAFMAKSAGQQIAEVPESEKGKPIQILEPVDLVRPQVIFFKQEPGSVHAAVIQARAVIARTDRDLAVIRIGAYDLFADGYPHLEFEEVSALYEGQEIATCGFPLGNYLSDQIGTITSSFTRGIISSILPASGVPEDLLTG